MLRNCFKLLQIVKTPALKCLSTATAAPAAPAATCSDVLAAVEELIAAGGIEEALRQLNELKALRVSPPQTLNTSYDAPKRRSRSVRVQYDDGLDYLRALCFLRLKDPLHARQALLEEIRCNPFNEDARDLLQRIDSSLRRHFELPAAIVEAEPLFAMVYQGLQGHSMLHWPRLYSLYAHAVQLCEDGVAGDFVECGVAGGGSAVMLAIVARHYQQKHPHLPPRRVLACDTFSGMPPPSAADTIENGAVAAQDTFWGSGTCSASTEWVENLAAAYKVDVEVVPGLFHKTLPGLYAGEEGRKVALLHIDSDWYESTKCCLENLYPHLSQRGVVQIDDFHYWDGCKRAVREYFVRQQLSLHSLQDIDNNAVWFRKI